MSTWGKDYTTFTGSLPRRSLFSVWTRIPDPGSSYPWRRGNMDVYVLRGAGWHLRCLVGNSSAESPDDARYNANTMLFVAPEDTWVGDFSYFESGGGEPEEPYRDWVWVAWEVEVGSDSYAMRQWLKFGVDAPVLEAGDSRVSFAKVRDTMMERGVSPAQADAWRPGPPDGFQVGSDHGYVTHARLDALDHSPDLNELDAIAHGWTPPDQAWASYPLEWRGGPVLEDQSGHARSLSIQPGGRLQEGVPGPSL